VDALLPYFAEATKGKPEAEVAQDAFDHGLIGKPMFKGAAVEELAHHLRDDGPQKPVAGLKTRLVAGAKGVEVPFQALPERRDMGLARSVELQATWVYATRALNLTLALINLCLHDQAAEQRHE
jgi:hypothetical protein